LQRRTGEGGGSTKTVAAICTRAHSSRAAPPPRRLPRCVRRSRSLSLFSLSLRRRCSASPPPSLPAGPPPRPPPPPPHRGGRARQPPPGGRAGGSAAAAAAGLAAGSASGPMSSTSRPAHSAGGGQRPGARGRPTGPGRCRWGRERQGPVHARAPHRNEKKSQHMLGRHWRTEKSWGRGGRGGRHGGEEGGRGRSSGRRGGQGSLRSEGGRAGGRAGGEGGWVDPSRATSGSSAVLSGAARATPVRHRVIPCKIGRGNMDERSVSNVVGV
jgi:hypothetical protein